MFTIIGADGKEYGPVSADQIREWLAQNRLNLTMQIRRDGDTAWQSLGDLPEFAPPAATTPPLPPPLASDPASAPLDPSAAYTTPPTPTTPAAPATPPPPEPLVFTGE